MPETFPADDAEVNEIDAVHAAQDLLDLSNGFDYAPSMPPPTDAQHMTHMDNNDGAEFLFPSSSVPIAQMTP